VRADEELEQIFAWRELRKVTQSLTLHYERKLYLLTDTPAHRRLIGKYVEVFQYPDGRVEIRVAGRALPYSTYDKLGAIDQGAIVENAPRSVSTALPPGTQSRQVVTPGNGEGSRGIVAR
jgi:hypothetical protein